MPSRDMRGRSPLDILHNCFRACYDNPIFHEDDGKRVPPQQNGTEKPGNPADYHGVETCNNTLDGRTRGFGGHVASEYMHSLPSPSPRTPSNDITFRGHRKRKRRCILCVICAFATLVVGIGLLIYFLEGNKHSESKKATAISLSKVEVNLTLKEGPFSLYQRGYRVPDSGVSRLLRRAFVYKISDVLSASDLSSVYKKTEVVLISNTNGSVSLTFIIRPPSHVTCPADCEARITAILLHGFHDSLFIVDSNTVSVKVYAVPVKPSKPSLGRCLPITLKECANKTGYTTWSTPNVLGHRSAQEVSTYLMKHRHLLDLRCYGYSTQFYCAAFFPECTAGNRKPLLPCKQFCTDVMSSCQKDYDKHNITVPFKCSDLPDDNDPNVCTQSPYIPGKCVPVPRDECRGVGFNKTAFPNAIGSVTVDKNGSLLLSFMTRLQSATNCFKHSLLFACSIITPPCSGRDPPNHYVPPCRSLCQKYKDRCEIFLNVFHASWPAVNCSSLPDSPDTSECLGYAEAREPEDRVCHNGYVECGGDKRTCIHKKWLCDGVQDCPDNSDEQHCAVCGPDEQRCSTISALCISKKQGCDGIIDCYGETDEMYCVRLEPSLEENVLQVRNPVMKNRWEEVCADGWNFDLSNMTCRQLGYSKSIATYYTDPNSTYFKSMVTTLMNGTDPTRLQSYLQKGLVSCPSGKVVQLLCWKAVCGARPAHIFSPLRVLGGEQVAPGTWPWMVSLHGGSGESFFCGASIIGDEWVLTAAHCVGGADNRTNYWTIKTGNTRRDVYSEHRQVRKPKRLFRHKKFNFDTVENDIALIQLERPFKLNDYVRAICLPEKATSPGTRCLVTGWGKANVSVLYYQPALREVTVDVTSWTHCFNALQGSEIAPPYELKKSMFCAGGTIAHDGCQGDSGGPLVCKKPNTTDKWYQSGIVSWGIICGLPNVPGVYTNLTYYMDWIHDIITNNTKNTG